MSRVEGLGIQGSRSTAPKVEGTGRSGGGGEVMPTCSTVNQTRW